MSLSGQARALNLTDSLQRSENSCALMFPIQTDGAWEKNTFNKQDF